MPEVLRELLASKKFLVLFAGIVTTLLVTKFGWDEATVTKIVGFFLTYLGAQGLADFGKAKAQEESSRKAPPLASALEALVGPTEDRAAQ